jgi:hypothetical protein
MSNEVVALISVVIAVAGLFLSLWQNVLTRRAIQAQVLLTLKDLAIEASYPDGIEATINLKSYAGFDSFAKAEPEKTQEVIYSTVDFLNFAAHLVEGKFLPRQTVWNRYFWAYRTCNEKLLTWWLEGQRRSHPRRFSAFESMCQRVSSVSDEAILAFDVKQYKKIQLGQIRSVVMPNKRRCNLQAVCLLICASRVATTVRKSHSKLLTPLDRWLCLTSALS